MYKGCQPSILARPQPSIPLSQKQTFKVSSKVFIVVSSSIPAPSISSSYASVHWLSYNSLNFSAIFWGRFSSDRSAISALPEDSLAPASWLNLELYRKCMLMENLTHQYHSKLWKFTRVKFKHNYYNIFYAKISQSASCEINTNFTACSMWHLSCCMLIYQNVNILRNASVACKT